MWQIKKKHTHTHSLHLASSGFEHLLKVSPLLWSWHKTKSYAIKSCLFSSFIYLSIQQLLANKIQHWDIDLAFCLLTEKDDVYGSGYVTIKIVHVPKTREWTFILIMVTCLFTSDIMKAGLWQCSEKDSQNA